MCLVSVIGDTQYTLSYTRSDRTANVHSTSLTIFKSAGGLTKPVSEGNREFMG